jgi:hypothetical protein
MDYLSDRVRNRLEREAWKWAHEHVAATRASSAPLVRHVIADEGGAVSEDAVEFFTAAFCDMVLRRQRNLAEFDRSERKRESWVRAPRNQ